jgi:hypothetical protein
VTSTRGIDERGSNSSGDSTGAAVGGRVAAITVIAAGLIAFFVINKRGAEATQTADEDVDDPEVSDLPARIALGEDLVCVK